MIWFLIICSGIAYLLYQQGPCRRHAVLALVTLLIIIALPLRLALSRPRNALVTLLCRRWGEGSGDITVDTIGHQTMEAFETSGPAYSLIHSAIGL